MNYSNLDFLKDLIRLMWPYKRRFFLGSLTRLTSDLVWLYPAWALSEIINIATTYTQGDSLQYFWFLIISVWCAGIYHFFTQDLAKYFVYPIAEKMQLDVYKQGINHMMLLDHDWHEQENSGNKVERINSAAQSVNQVVRLYVDLFVESTVNIIGMSIVLFTVENWLSGLMLIFFFTYYYLNRVMIQRPAKETYKTSILWEEYNGLVFESVNNISTIKSLGLRKGIMKWLSKSSKRLHKQISTRVFWYRIRSGTLNLYQEVFLQVLLLIVILQVFAGNLEVGIIALVLLYFFKISSSASEFAEVTYRMELSRVSVMRFKDIMNAKPTAETSGTQSFPSKWKTLQIKDLSFSYHGRKVLKNLNLNIKRGEKIGIVGISGTGKSTLLKLLLKLYDRYEGEILFDQKELKNIKRNSYLKHFSNVPQETELFNLSLKENITMALDGKSNKKQFESALKIAHVKDFLNKLPEGVDSLIGEKGIKLSGGERQRLGIARAVYKQPEILFLDEATSHLDADSETKIQESLHTFFKDVTAIVIAHRLSTLKEMDRIVVMKKGQVVEEGSFQTLIKRKGHFYELWKKQKL